MLIFLDIDGVLRRDGSELYRFQPDLLEIFEETLGLLPEAAVVVTSSWREAFGLVEIRRHFSAETGRRIIGVTPSDHDVAGHRRDREVRAFRSAHPRSDRPWVAIDDDPEHYPLSDNVLLVDGRRGFDRSAAGRLLLAAGFGPYVRPGSAPVDTPGWAPARHHDADESDGARPTPTPPPLAAAMWALRDHDGDLPGPVAAPERRWRTREEQEECFRQWWLRRAQAPD